MRRTLSALAFAGVIAGALAASSFAAEARWTDAEAHQRLADLTEDRTSGLVGYMDEATVDRHLGDDIDPLCDWVDGHVPADAANADAAANALGQEVPGGDGMPLVLLAICGYHGNSDQQRQSREAQYEYHAANPYISDSKLRMQENSILRDNGPHDRLWYYKAPYLWGEPRLAPTTFR